MDAHQGRAQAILGIMVPKGGESEDDEKMSPEEADQKGKQAMAEFIKAVNGHNVDDAWAAFQAADCYSEKARPDGDEDEDEDEDDEEHGQPE